MQPKTKIKKLYKEHLISLMIPAYKQEKTIEKDLRRIKNTLDQIRYNYEIIVVVDGKVDKTFENAQKVTSSKIRVIGYEENRGKGYALRFGMIRTKGDLIAFIDAGMDINPNGLSMLLEHFEWYNADIIVGSKRHPASKVNYPWQRKIISFCYQLIVKILFGLNIRDTQAGIKFFRRKVMEDIFPRLLVKRYAFDIEILAVAHSLGYQRIFEAPIEINWSMGSGLTFTSIWKESLHVLIDTLAVFYRLKILHYYDNVHKHQWRHGRDLDQKNLYVVL